MLVLGICENDEDDEDKGDDDSNVKCICRSVLLSRISLRKTIN